MPDRYNIYNSDGQHNLSVSQSEDGEWVRYEDIIALAANIATPPQKPNFYPSDIPKLTPDQKGVLEFAMTMMNSGYPREILRSWIDAPTYSVKPNASHVPGNQSSHSWHHGGDESIWRCDCGERRTDFLESSDSSVKP